MKENPSSAEELKYLAAHFAQSEWDYTRLCNIKHIRYEGDWSGYHRIDRRFKRFLSSIFHKNRLTGQRTPLHISIAVGWRIYMRTEKHLPDGILDGGAVITHWEETGEYLQLVQPMVGELLAEWLLAEPKNPYAVQIIAKLDEICSRYNDRIQDGEIGDQDVSNQPLIKS